jgi:hypothetical protein
MTAIIDIHGTRAVFSNAGPNLLRNTEARIVQSIGRVPTPSQSADHTVPSSPPVAG